jgi:hypothetical protein
MRRYPVAVPVTAAVIAAALGACDAPTSSSSLEVTLTNTPDPAVASPASGVYYTIKGDDSHPDQSVAYPWRTTFSVSIQETGGKAVDITAVNLNVKQASGGIVITPSGGATEYYQFNSSASGNHVNAHSSAAVGFEVYYDLPNKGREALVTVTIGFVDADSNSYSRTLGVKVAP